MLEPGAIKQGSRGLLSFVRVYGVPCQPRGRNRGLNTASACEAFDQTKLPDLIPHQGRCQGSITQDRDTPCQPCINDARVDHAHTSLCQHVQMDQSIDSLQAHDWVPSNWNLKAKECILTQKEMFFAAGVPHLAEKGIARCSRTFCALNLAQTAENSKFLAWRLPAG